MTRKTFMLLLLFFRSVYTWNSFFQLAGKCSGMCFVPFLITLIAGEIFSIQQTHKAVDKRRTSEWEERIGDGGKLCLLCCCNSSFMCFFALFSHRMIYVLCTIKRMFGYHSSTCILLWLCFDSVGSKARKREGDKERGSRDLFSDIFLLICWCDL